jgi:hypothetical protein
MAKALKSKKTEAQADTPGELVNPPLGSAFYTHVEDPAATFSHMGATYVPDDEGYITAPFALAETLVSHGFVITERYKVAPAAPAAPQTPVG